MAFFLIMQVVDDAISAGIDGYDAEMKSAVRDAATGLRLTQKAAMDIAAKAVSISPLLIALSYGMFRRPIPRLEHSS